MERIEKFLTEKQQSYSLRTLKPADRRSDGKIYFGTSEFWDFSSNDYLSLSGHPKLIQAGQKAAEQFGSGAAASRLLSGDLTLHHQLEQKTAALKGKEDALLFNSGYQANLGIISSLFSKSDVVFSDKLSHASIIDGITLSGAKHFRFRHNDPDHLETLLKKSRTKFRDCLIITETVFSMDGDIAPLEELVRLKEKYNCILMVDEAHATGIFGHDGSGMVSQLQLAQKVDLIMGTFGKAMGSFGAYVACSKQIKQFLVNTSRSFIYSTALPPAVIAANIATIDLLAEEPFRRKQLLQNAEFFRNELTKRGFDILGSSQIVPLMVNTSEKAVAMSNRLKENGFWALPIRPPTVPQGQSRLRFSLNYDHNPEVLQSLIEEIERAFNV